MEHSTTFEDRCQRWDAVFHEDRALSLASLIRTADDARTVAELACADALPFDALDESIWEAWYELVSAWDRAGEHDDVGAMFDAVEADLKSARVRYQEHQGADGWLCRAQMFVRALRHAHSREVANPRYLARERAEGGAK